MSFKVNDRVKKLKTNNLIGTVVGIFEKDEYVGPEGKRTLYASKGDLKIEFDSHVSGSFYQCPVKI